MILILSLLLVANFVGAKNELLTQGGYCNIASYVQVNTAEILNFPPTTNVLKTFIDTTVINQVPVFNYEMVLVGTSGYVSHYNEEVNEAFSPGMNFHSYANININSPALNESYYLKMTLTNQVETVLCYQINFGVWKI